MKIKQTTLLLFLTLFSSLFVLQKSRAAVTPTPTTSVTQKVEEQINNLKDRIASRVAQMNLVEKRGFIGTVTDVSETQLTVNDLQNNPRIIDVDELTKFSSPDAKSSFGISDIAKGTTIGIIGLYNKDSRRLLARWVDVLKLPTVLTGGILAIDKEGFTLTIATTNSQSTTIDVEDITKTTAYTKDGGVVRFGFSKLVTGQRVLVVGFPNAKNSNEIIASRIVVFPDLPVNPKIPMINPTDTVPSTGSGKKLTPITK